MEQENNRYENEGNLIANQISREVEAIVNDVKKEGHGRKKADIERLINTELQLYAEELRERWFPNDDHWVVVKSDSILRFSQDEQKRSVIGTREGEAYGELCDIRLFSYPGHHPVESASNFIGVPMLILNPDQYREYEPERLSEELKRNRSFELIPADRVQKIESYQFVQEETFREFNDIVISGNSNGNSNTTMD